MGTIVAFGDSYTSGLNKPTPNNRYYVTPFVQHIANHLGYEFIGLGIDGNSNPAIASDIMNYDFKKGDVAFVTWSGLTRDWDTGENGFKKANLRIRKHRDYGHCHFMSIFSIRSVENYLTKNQIPFIMTSAFVECEEISNENWDEWIPGTLRELAGDNMEVCLHPNAKGHELIADKLLHLVRNKL